MTTQEQARDEAITRLVQTNDNQAFELKLLRVIAITLLTACMLQAVYTC